MSRYKPYPAYKESGVEWLGRVPEGWEVKRLRFVASPRNSNVDKKNYEGQAEVRLCNYVDVYYNDFITSDLEFMASTASASEMDEFGLCAGDVVMTKDSETADDIGIPAFVPKTLPGVVCGYHLTMLKPSGVEGEFLFRYIQSRPSKAHFFVEVSGVTRFGLGQDAIKDLWVPIPSKEEQSKLCRWISEETSRIDGLVEKKTRFIELLREKRQALITHAVTKGLDPKAKTKDSGVEWLGEVPEHWNIQKLKWLASFQSGDFITSESIEPTGSYPVFGGNGIRGYTETFTHEGKYVLIGRQGALCGNINYSFGKFWPSEHAVVLSPYKELDTLWIGELLRTMNLNQYSIASAQPGLAVERITDLSIPIPPLSEQIGIAEMIRSKTTRIDSLIAQTERSIELLKERRAALITAAVTGQIDLREAA